MKKAYFAINFSNRHKFINEIESLKSLFKKNEMELLVFVDQYNFKDGQEQDMMEIAFREIDTSDFLIAELTAKSIGVGIEIGYANAKGKPVIYLRKKGSEYSATAFGSSSYQIEYNNISNLKSSIKKILFQLQQKNLTHELHKS